VDLKPKIQNKKQNIYSRTWLLCIVYSQTCGHHPLCVLFTAKLAATTQFEETQCQSSCQIAATPLVGQQIQRIAPSAAIAAATCEADRVLLCKPRDTTRARY
jgi:hypothetical protein